MALFNPPSFLSPEALVRLRHSLCRGRPRGTLRPTELPTAPSRAPHGVPQGCARGLSVWPLGPLREQGRGAGPGGRELPAARGGSAVAVFTFPVPFQPEDTHQPPGRQRGRAAGRAESRWVHFLSLSHLWLFVLLRLELETAKPNRFFRGNVTLPGTVSPFFWLPDGGKN